MVLRLVLPLLLWTHHAFALNILAIASLPLYSHYMAFHPFFRELATRGHHVTVMNNFPQKDLPFTMEFVDLSTEESRMGMGYMTPINFYENFDSTYLHLYNIYRHIVLTPASCKSDCENFFTHENIRAHLAKRIKYDVVFVEMFGPECGLSFAATMFDAPIIGIASHVMQPTAYPRLGLPFDFSSDPYYFSKGGANPSLYNKVEAFIMDSIFETFKWYNQKLIYEVFNRYLPNNTLDIEKVARERMKMFFSYQHFSLTGARVLSPQVLEIGGIHIGQPKPVPQNIEKFLSDADHGAIYVSFGSNLKANDMSPEKRQEFLNAFRKIPQKVIWKYENATLPEGNERVYTSNWLPQLDILCHPKVIGFVSHGGMLSLSESTYCGKPAVMVPFFGDQFGNVAAAEQAGLSRTLYFDRLNGDNLAEALREITSPKMQQTAKKISNLWHDRPMPVMESAIYWTEYVARNRDADAPPSLPSKRTMWYEKMLLDVALVLLALLLAPIFLLAAVIKLFKLILCKSKVRDEPKGVTKIKSKKA